MLVQRVITAIVLLAVLSVALLVQTKWPLLVFLSIAVGLTAFEWFRLTAPTARMLGIATGTLLAAGTIWQADLWIQNSSQSLTLLQIALPFTALVWLLAVPVYLFRAPVDRRSKANYWSIFCPICLYSTWGALSLLWISHGAWSLLSLLILIWIADIFAYFGGKKFGRNKLAPRISPGKTREGAICGLLGVLTWMFGTAQVHDSYAGMLVDRWGWLGLFLFSVLLGLLAIMGDLFESLLKRQAGVKDSSQLLPGHGGVYDRVDAVVAVVPVAFLLISGFLHS